MGRQSQTFQLLLVFLTAVICVGCGPRITLTADTKVVGVSQPADIKLKTSSKKDSSFFWKSSDPSVAKVVGGGALGAAVYGMAPGKAKITAEGITTGARGRITLTVIALEELPGEIEKATPEGKLLQAVEAGDQAALDDLLAKGADANYRSDRRDGMTLLGAAAWGHQLSMVKRLLAEGAKANRRDANGATPLMHAAGGGNSAIIDVLVAAGAKTNLKAKDGRSALDYAFGGGNRQAFIRLVNAGARKAKSDGAREWVKQDTRYANQGRRGRMIAFLWFVLFLAALRPPRIYALLARRRVYYKSVAEDNMVFVEADRVTHTLRRKIQAFPGVPPVRTRSSEAEAFEAGADMEASSVLEFHEQWNWPYTTHTRFAKYLRLCALTVLSVPMFVIWTIIAYNTDSRIPPFSWLPKGGDVMFFIGIAFIAVPPFLFLLSIIAFVRLQMARPSPRQQVIAFAAIGPVLLGFVGLLWLIYMAAMSIAG
jgi:hypothetical protein